MMYKRKQSIGGIFQTCAILSVLVSASISPSCLVQGFATPAHTAFPRPYISNKDGNEMKVATKKSQRENGRSLALKAASFTSSATTTSFRTFATRRIRRSASSTRLYSNEDDSDSSSPYWFAKIKTSSSSSSSSSDTSQQSLPKQDLPTEQDTPPITPPQPPQPQQPIRTPPVRHSEPVDTSWTAEQDTPPITPPQPPQQPLQPIPPPPGGRFVTADTSWTAERDTPITPPQPPQQPQQPIRPPPAGHSVTADMSWTEIKPRTTTTSLHPAQGSGFMPIFGVVPGAEMKPPPPPPTPYKEASRSQKPKGASDQETRYQETSRPKKAAWPRTEQRTKQKGASDQERELSVANIAQEPMQSGTEPEPFVPEAPPLPQVVSTTNDYQSQGIVVPRTIKVQEVDEDDEEYDDNSVSPIILEYLSEDGETGDAYMQTIIFPFRVDPNVRPEEQLGRENDAPMFTPAVKADIYKVLRSPNDPKGGGEAPSSGPPSSAGEKASSSPFAATLLAKMDEGTYAFCDRSLYESIEQHKQEISAESPSAQQWDLLAKYTPLNDDQMLKAVAGIGQTSPNSLAVTKAFEAYLSQKAWAWGDYQASAFSVEFLIAFGNELSTRLDINHRIRSRKLSDQELTILSKPPFCNYVQLDIMRIFQNKWTDNNKE